MQRKEITRGFLLNFIASVLPIAIMQLIVYPIMSGNMSNSEYGQSLTFYSLLMLIPNSFGVVLSDLRLLYNKDYSDNKIEGDFNILLKIFLIISFCCMAIVSIVCYGKFPIIKLLTISITTIFVYIVGYLFVELLLQQAYEKILYNALHSAIGYIVGVIVFKLVGLWEVVYFFPYLLSFIYLVKHTNLLKESNAKTPNFKTLFKEYWMLLFSTLITNAISYADRLVLYPLLGGECVAIYYTASILGKLISMVVAPINRLILGVLSNRDRLSNAAFLKILFYGIGIHVIAYFVCLLITKPVLGILYPQLVESVMPYVTVATLASILSAMSSMLQPFVLRYTLVKWQMFIHTSSAVIYFVMAFILQHYAGLMGFCWGCVIGFAYKVVVMIVIYFRCKRDALVIEEEEKENLTCQLKEK